MASTESTTVVETVACGLDRCGSCRGVVLSLTDGHLTDCQHECHDPDPDQGDQEEVALNLFAETELEHELEPAHFGPDA